MVCPGGPRGKQPGLSWRGCHLSRYKEWCKGQVGTLLTQSTCCPGAPSSSPTPDQRRVGDPRPAGLPLPGCTHPPPPPSRAPGCPPSHSSLLPELNLPIPGAPRTATKRTPPAAASMASWRPTTTACARCSSTAQPTSPLWSPTWPGECRGHWTPIPTSSHGLRVHPCPLGKVGGGVSSRRPAFQRALTLKRLPSG